MLDAAHVAISTNWGRFRNVVGGVVGLNRRSWSTTIWMFVLFILAFVVFLVAYIFIKLTSK